MMDKGGFDPPTSRMLSVRIQASIAAEKCRRFPVGDKLVDVSSKRLPKVRLKEGNGRQKTWQHVSEEVLGSLKLDPRRCSEGNVRDDMKEGYIDISNREKLLIYTEVEPWNTNDVSKVEFNTSMIKECKKDASDKIKKYITMKTIESLGPFDKELWTDGSVEEKIGAGAGMIYMKNSCIATAGSPSGYLSSSYRSELVAIDISLKHIKECNIADHNSSLLICTDSQSAISALSCGPLQQTEILASNIWSTIIWLVKERKLSKIVFQFVFSHCGVRKNEAVDMKVAEVLKENVHLQHTAPIVLVAVKAHVKSELRKGWKGNINMETHRYKICKNAFSNINDRSLSRKEQTLLAQLRCGECYTIGIFKHRLENSVGLCRWCTNEEESVYHVYELCNNAKLVKLRKDMGLEGCSALVKEGRKAIEFLYKAIDILKE